MEKEEFLGLYRHSLAHILAKAVIEIFGKENVQYAIGPQIADGFYYDFVLPRTVTNDDFKTIEDKMREIIKRREDWKREEISRNDALEMFKDQKFKKELIEDLPEDELLTVYYTGEDFVDLCRGPHVENSQFLMNAAFQIKSVSGSYWRGDEKREQLQRIYVYAFPDKKELKEHLAMIKEAMERDHKKIGPQLELFMFDETAPGMPYWLPRGWKMYNALIDYWREIHERHGYTEISAPVLNSKRLWEISGHWGHYKKNMFLVPPAKDNPVSDKASDLIDIEDEDRMFAAKPMNCPNAIKVYQNKQRSYKDLPLRFNELDVIHRREKSGELNGLLRVQEFRQDDSHNLIMQEQIEEEIDDIMDIAGEIYSTFGLSYIAELSTRPDDYMGDINDWNAAEASLKRILDRKYGEGGYEINEGDGAFYGPKIDLKMKDCIGREWQMGTIQLDYQLPLNFDMKYVAADSSMKRPVMVHRAIFGSFERFIGILIENFKGSFPFWLSPYQVGIVPIRVENNEYAQEIVDICRKNRIRCEVDYSDKNMKDKIKTFRNYHDPYVLVLGNAEAENRTVSINIRGGKQLRDVSIDKFIEICKTMNDTHSIDLIDTL
ncbi:MAG: threonine--tRNA ligase [Lachnospiraceae bacterium]|nr:threonine--tRNA ligase [Lachnospiraceae bacterium]